MTQPLWGPGGLMEGHGYTEADREVPAWVVVDYQPTWRDQVRLWARYADLPDGAAEVARLAYQGGLVGEDPATVAHLIIGLMQASPEGGEVAELLYRAGLEDARDLEAQR